MLTTRINFKNFKIKKNLKLQAKILPLFKKKNEIINSLSKDYKDSFNKKELNKFKKFNNFRLIGMGGSTLGAQAIYSFLCAKIKKIRIYR